MQLDQVIIAPLITEKATTLAERANQVVFKVHPKANKHDIRRAVEELFKVNVLEVRTCNFLGKVRRLGRSVGRRPSWKKAYVTLQEGQRIEFFEGV